MLATIVTCQVWVVFTHVLKDDIVGRDSVGRHEEESVLVDFEDLANFTACNLLQSVHLDLGDRLHIVCGVDTMLRCDWWLCG